MIKSFKHKGLRDFFLSGIIKGINPEHSLKLTRILTHLNDASQVKDMNLPGFRLHSLKGNMKDLWSITVLSSK